VETDEAQDGSQKSRERWGGAIQKRREIGSGEKLGYAKGCCRWWDVERHHQSSQIISSAPFPSTTDAVAAEDFLIYITKLWTVICAKGNHYQFFSSECGEVSACDKQKCGVLQM
jgi:hypothetical protein